MYSYADLGQLVDFAGVLLPFNAVFATVLTDCPPRPGAVCLVFLCFRSLVKLGGCSS